MVQHNDDRRDWLDLEGFEKEKFEKVRACPKCPAMMKRSGESYEADQIEHEWHCEECDVFVVKTFNAGATRWHQYMTPEAPVQQRSDPKGLRTLEAFEREKFEQTRACPVCPGMLHDQGETHLEKAVQYTWECAQCGGRVTQRFDEARLVWEPAA